MPESNGTKHRRDLVVVALAVLCSVVLAAVVAGGSFFWNELEQARADSAALADQVRSLGGQPVAEGKPGARGDQGPQGERGPAGPIGPVGPAGPRGPIGITGQSPQCLLMPTRCVGPKGATGATGSVGAAGKQGEMGPAGPQGEPGTAGETGPQGPAGQQGPAGVQGEPGATGPKGDPGRAVSDTDCVGNGSESYWRITYSDGTEATSPGPCRVAIELPPTTPAGGETK